MTQETATVEGEDTRQSGRVCLHPAGPHFYVHAFSFEGELPTGMPDALVNIVHEELASKFGDLNNVSWADHIEPHTTFATAKWDMDADDPYKSVDIEIDDKNDDWYMEESQDYPW